MLHYWFLLVIGVAIGIVCKFPLINFSSEILLKKLVEDKKNLEAERERLLNRIQLIGERAHDRVAM